VGVEMERMYRFKIPQTPTTSNSTTADSSIGEEGVASLVVEKEGEGPPTWQEIAITSGCNQAFFDVMMAVCERGDGVILPVPWVSSSVVCKITRRKGRDWGMQEADARTAGSETEGRGKKRGEMRGRKDESSDETGAAGGNEWRDEGTIIPKRRQEKEV
jgi:hypothetical protein